MPDDQAEQVRADARVRGQRRRSPRHDADRHKTHSSSLSSSSHASLPRGVSNGEKMRPPRRAKELAGDSLAGKELKFEELLRNGQAEELTS